MGGALAGIDAPDDRTVVFRFKRPYAPLLSSSMPPRRLSSPGTCTRGATRRRTRRMPARSVPGPSSSSPTRRAPRSAWSEPGVLQAGLPYLDELVMRVIPDAGTQVLALENGEVDFLWGVPGPQQSRLGRFARPHGPDRVQPRRVQLHHDGELQPRSPDPEGRSGSAAPWPTPRSEAFLRQVLFGEGKVAAAPISSEISWAHARGLPMPGFDAPRRSGYSTRSVEEGGGRDPDRPRGRRRRRRDPAVIDFLHFPTFAKYGELVRQQLGAVGIGVTRAPRAAVFAPTVFKDRASIPMSSRTAMARIPRSGCAGCITPRRSVRRRSPTPPPTECPGRCPLRPGQAGPWSANAARELSGRSRRSRPGAALRLAGGDPEHAGLGGALRGLQAMDGALRRGGVLQAKAR